MQRNPEQEESDPKHLGGNKDVSSTPAEQARGLLKFLQFSLNGVMVRRTSPSVQNNRDWREIDTAEWDEQFAFVDNYKEKIQTCREAIRHIQTQQGQLENKVREVKTEVNRTLIRLERFVPLMYQVGPIDSPCLKRCDELSNQLEEAIVLIEDLATQQFVGQYKTGESPQKNEHATEESDGEFNTIVLTDTAEQDVNTPNNDSNLPLGEYQETCLLTLVELKAIDSKSAIPRAEVALKAFGLKTINRDARALRALKGLKKKCLVDSTNRGRSATWYATQNGVDTAKSLAT